MSACFMRASRAAARGALPWTGIALARPSAVLQQFWALGTGRDASAQALRCANAPGLGLPALRRRGGRSHEGKLTLRNDGLLTATARPPAVPVGQVLTE